MSDIILGNNFRLYYNTDTGNALPQGIDNEEIENLAGFPVLTINSDTSSYDTYDSDYVSKLLADMSVADLEIVVNYVPDSVSATFLDAALLNQTEFQLILVYYYDTVAGQISYAIVNGQLYSGTVTGDKDSVVQKTYNFTTTQVKARSMVAMAAKALFEGDFGIGSDGIDIPQYAPDLPTGNSLIKIPAAQSGNPASADMMGVGWIDNKQVCELAVTKAGALAIYARNANTAWTRISTTTLSDATYVALTGNQNISGNKTFTGTTVHSGATTLTGTTTAGVVNTGALTSTTGRFTGTLTGVAGTFTGAVSTGALTSTTGTFSGALSAASLSLTAPLPISSGGTGNANGTVARLTTSRTFITNLASTTAAAFDGTANNSHGVTGILPLANGGTGASTAAQAAINLKVVPYNGAVTTAVDINDYGITDTYVGYWQFSTVAGYASANLPEATAGILEVIRGGDYGGMQKYTSVTGYVWIRTLTASWNATTKPWADWKPAGYQATKAYATDLNALTVANTYSCSASTTNKPDGITVGGWCFHYSHAATGNYLQIYVTATTSNNAQANRTFQRTYNGTTWTAWSESYTTLNKPSATDVGALPIVAGFSDADVNTIITAGVYSITSIAPNIPAAITGTMEVLVRQGGVSITQIYHCNASSANFQNRHFIRTGTVSGSTTTWTTWESLTPTTQNLVTGTDLNTLTTSGRYYGSFVNSPNNANASALVDVSNTGGSTVMLQSLTFTTANITWTRRYVSNTWSEWVQVASSSNIGTMALPITGGTLTGTTGLTTTGAVTSRENNVTYRQLISRADAFGPYTGYNRIDQVDGTLPTAQISIGDISARLTTTGGDPWGRTLGGMGMYYDTTGGGSTLLYARNAAGALSSTITFAGDTGIATMRGALVTNALTATTGTFTGAVSVPAFTATTGTFTGAVTVPSLTITNNLPITSGGTGAATAAAARTALGVAYGTAAGTVAQGNDSRLNTVGGKTGGVITSAITIPVTGSMASDWHTSAGGGCGVRAWQTPSNNGIELNNTTTDSGEGALVSYLTAGWYTGNWQLGTVRGGSTAISRVQLNVLATAGGSSASFMFYPNGRLQAESNIGLGGRVITFTNATSTYLECVVDGGSKGINFFDSDETLKEDIENADGNKALDIIENIRPISYKFKDYTYKITEKDDEGNDVDVEKVQKGSVHQYGVIAQEFEKLLPEGVITHGDGKKALDPLEVLGLLLTTCHEQQKIIKHLQEDVEVLKNK